MSRGLKRVGSADRVFLVIVEHVDDQRLFLFARTQDEKRQKHQVLRYSRDEGLIAQNSLQIQNNVILCAN